MILITITIALLLTSLVLIVILLRQNAAMKQKMAGQDQSLQTLLIEQRTRQENQQDLQNSIFKLLNEQQKSQQDTRERFDAHQLKSLKILTESLQNGMTDIRNAIMQTLNQNAETLNKQVDKLTLATDTRLKEISGQVDKRLSEGFEKTNATFNDVIKRLALIDQAQKKITELSSDVVSLQSVLADKRSRGAFGEVQLEGLIRNMLPENHFAFQHTLTNGKRADCMLFLPKPTGHIAIDAKFPLESYQRLANHELPDSERFTAERQFVKDIRKHIDDISQKYIIPKETADGAMMFIPAEAVFAKIHGDFPELVEAAHKARVWLVSPTTMMAVLTTAKAVLKDEATRKQVHVIQQHLVTLSKDFDRFQGRMDKLAKHIELAHTDVEAVHKSSKKISSRFTKIEHVELEEAALKIAIEED